VFQLQVLTYVLLRSWSTAYTEAGSLIQPAHFMREDVMIMPGSHVKPPPAPAWSFTDLIYSFRALWTSWNPSQTVDDASNSNNEGDSCTVTGNDSLNQPSCGNELQFRTGQDVTLSSRLKAKRMNIPDFEDEF